VIETCKVTLMGDHEQGALFDTEGFSIDAERAIFWTREELESPNDRNNERRWEFLAELPRTHRINRYLFVHGSPCNPLGESIFPDDIYNHRKMEQLFQLVERYCFQGHTHIPGVFTENLEFFAPEEIDYECTLGEGKVMINVGSVGQPRDGDPRACYVVLDGGQSEGTPSGSASAERSPGAESQPPQPVRPATVIFRRLPYDFEATIQKIYAISELEPFLGDRLRQGR
jgi:diadenosine tetraphosphatase ApaH/serine/threonine PP2A family protein phosphatase